MADRDSIHDFDLIGWLSTEQAGASVGMSSAWVRKQIDAGRLRATILSTGSRPTYRIAVSDWRDFRSRFVRRTKDDVR